jgi:pyridoxal phosphate enzyme (YggS family)
VRAALDSVRERIERACERSRRRPDTVRLVAVSKTFPAADVRRAMDHGHTLFGENRVQEALAKIEQVGPGARWHLVGHLQRNKVRHAVGVFELIHSIDGIELVRELDRRAAAAGVVQPVLLQVNLAAETTKHGTPADELPALVDATAALDHVALTGLMTIPPPVERAEDSRPWFARLRELGLAMSRRAGRDLSELSMGMTDDFEVAIEEGATLVRVGRAIFGERDGG